MQRRQHLRGRRPARYAHRRHALRRGQADHPREDDLPEPVISIAIEPKTKVDVEKLGVALQKLAYEDPSFRTFTNEETAQTIIAGMGELHLEIIVDRLQAASSRSSRTSASPRSPTARASPRRSTPSTSTPSSPGGRGQYGHVLITLEPGERGSGYVFENEVVGGAIPKEFIPAVEKGIREAMNRGVLAGYPVIDVKVELYDGSYHDVDSSDTAFKMAGLLAFQDAAKRRPAPLLEPIMSVEAVIPEGAHGRRHGRPDAPARPHPVAGGPRWHAGHRRARCRCRRCPVTRPTFAAARRAAPPT